MKITWLSLFIIAFFLTSIPAQSQTKPSDTAPASGCPVQFLHFSPSGVSVKLKNESGKAIVGLTFHAALADATEHWRWYHWDFDLTRPVREFNWNRTIKRDEKKNITWYNANLDFDHGGGGAFVLTSALFEDGSSWEAPPFSASCKLLWYNSHKKNFLKPISLPPVPAEQSDPH